MNSFKPWRVLEAKLCRLDNGREAWAWLRQSSCDLTTLLEFLLEAHVTEQQSECLTKIEGMGRPLRANLLCLFSLVLPRLCPVLLRRVLRVLVDRRTPSEIAAHWDTRIAAALMQRLDHDAPGPVNTTSAHYMALVGRLSAAGALPGVRLPMAQQAPHVGGSSRKRGRELVPGGGGEPDPTPKLVRTGRWVDANAAVVDVPQPAGICGTRGENADDEQEPALLYTQASQNSQSLEQEMPAASRQQAPASPSGHSQYGRDAVRYTGSGAGDDDRGRLLFQSPPPLLCAGSLVLAVRASCSCVRSPSPRTSST